MLKSVAENDEVINTQSRGVLCYNIYNEVALVGEVVSVLLWLFTMIQFTGWR